MLQPDSELRPMARRSESSPQAADLTVDQMRRGIERISRRIAEVEDFDPRSVRERFDHRANVLGVGIEESLASVFGHGTVEYNRYSYAQNLDAGPLSIGGYDSPSDVLQFYTEGKQRSLLLLRQAVKGLEEEIADREHLASLTAAAETVKQPDLTKVFVVHGHDDAAKQGVARFIEKLGFEAIILHERPNKGRTIITKFREEAGGVGFAVVLMTPDDVGGAVPFLAGRMKPRARQNVVFELGFFIGALGPDRVAALIKGNIDRPSDFDGVVYISLENGNWQQELARELKAAGYAVDWNKVMA